MIYLTADLLGEQLIGPAVDRPVFEDPTLRAEVSALDVALIQAEELEAETRLALVVERIGWQLAGGPVLRRELRPSTRQGRLVAGQIRERLDADPMRTPPLAELAAEVGVTVPHLIRAFTREFGIPPHRYVIGRRLDAARQRLLGGEPLADVAAATGFYDQAHLTRHFRQLLRTTPGRYQRSGRLANPLTDADGHP